MSRRGPVSGRSSLWVLDLRSTSKYVTTLVGFTGLSDAVHTVRIDVVGTQTGQVLRSGSTTCASA